MKKYLIVLSAFIFCCVMLFALEVDRAEIESAGTASSVVFINYAGPHKIINTAEQIRSIGSGLAVSVAQNSAEQSRAGQLSRYHIIHAVDPSVKEKLDADILILGDQAIVDHVDNVRRIIAAYLEAAYGYSRKDAETLAVFVTVYNAVYRGNMDAFNQKYKKIVTSNLSADKAGLSLNYAEWPGKTQIVIPLSDVLAGDTGTVDTSVISDTKVIESLKEESGKGIDERKNMVTIKEKEAEKSQVKAEQAQKKAVEVKKEAAVEKKKSEELKKEAVKAQKEAEAKPGDKEAQKKADEVKKAAEKQEEKTAEMIKAVEIYEKKAEEAQQTADKKQTEAQKERIDIAKDQQQLIRESAGLDEVIKAAYGLKITNEKEKLSAMVLVDTKTGRTVKESPVSVIRNRVIYLSGKDYIAVAGKTGGNAAVKLVKLDSKNMEIIAQSEEELAPDSVLVKEGDFYYVVVQDGKNYTAAKYDADLKQVLKSNVYVLPGTPITVTPEGVMVTDTYGFAKLLKTDDLQGVE
ncbi:P83/100 family protein [Treponema sp. HNW]|uniref:P83/100 family protein n=1 Tax=Treponema sp. HNW TaxID=3116654 RepID=UPI003D124EBC